MQITTFIRGTLYNSATPAVGDFEYWGHHGASCASTGDPTRLIDVSEMRPSRPISDYDRNPNYKDWIWDGSLGGIGGVDLGLIFQTGTFSPYDYTALDPGFSVEIVPNDEYPKGGWSDFQTNRFGGNPRWVRRVIITIPDEWHEGFGDVAWTHLHGLSDDEKDYIHHHTTYDISSGYNQISWIILLGPPKVSLHALKTGRTYRFFGFCEGLDVGEGNGNNAIGDGEFDELFNPVQGWQAGGGLVLAGFTIAVDRVELEIAGTVHTISIDPKGPLQRDGVPYSWMFDYEFTGHEGHTAIKIRAVDRGGAATPWRFATVPPVPVITYNESELPALKLSAEDSYSLTGTIDKWNWTFYDTYIPLGDIWPDIDIPGLVYVPTSTENTVLDVEELAESVFDETISLPIHLRIEDYSELTGCEQTVVKRQTAHQREPHVLAVDNVLQDTISALHDPNNIMTTAVRQDGAVHVRRFIGGTSTREELASISGARNPSLFRHGSSLHLTVSHDAAWHIYQSHDFGESFSQAAANIMDNNNYSGVRACGLGDGGALLAGLKRNTREVWTAYSLDSVHFSDPANSGHTIPEGQRKTIDVFQESSAGASRIRITNGDQFTIVNDAYAEAGSTWEAI